MHCQQGQRAPAPEALAPLGPALAAANKKASRHALEKPLAIESGHATAAGRRAGAGSPTGATMKPTPGSGALCMKQASTSSRLVATLDTWWRSAGNALRSVQLWG
jgi:hypothetical protein